MVISTLEELRLYSPSNAIDHFEVLAGFLDSSEHDFLADKLGDTLYDMLTDWYRDMMENGTVEQYVADISNGNTLEPMPRLLTIAQRMVVFDALQRAIDIQAISVNGAGVNVATATEYAKADAEAVKAYKSTCYKEAHSALNRLLILLEKWTKQCEELRVKIEESENVDSSIIDLYASLDPIIKAWKGSRYYFLSTTLLIPTCEVLQQYVNIYDSREKFIQYLPDLRYVQEDILAPVISEDVLDALVPLAVNGTTDKLLARIIHKLRKAEAKLLAVRIDREKPTSKATKETSEEAIRMITDVGEYMMLHYDSLPEDIQEAFQSSSFYKQPDTYTSHGDIIEDADRWINNKPGSSVFVTPAIPII